MLGTLERLRLAAELRDTGLNLRAGPDTRKRVMLERKADSLRAILLGKREPISLEGLDLFAPKHSLATIKAYLASRGEVSDERKATDAAYLAIVVHYLNWTHRVTGDGSPGEEQLYADLARAAEGLKSPEVRKAKCDRFIAGGTEVFDLPEKIKAASDEYDALVAAESAATEAVREELRKAQEELEPLREQAYGTYDRVHSGELTEEQGKAIRDQFNLEYRNKIDVLRQAAAAKIDESRERRTALLAVKAAAAKELRERILAESPVTAEQAQAWAKAQTIQPGAVAALKRLGYPAAKVREDMAEFYRLSGGRLSGITIRASRSKRASAEGIHGHDSSIINLGKWFTKRTLFHELAHHLEADPEALAAGKGFLEKRREDARIYKLRDLTGNKAYGPKELAHKDHWFDAYVGKLYDNVTEVFSMGVESFSDDNTLAERIRRDPQMFALITGFLKAKPDPLFGTVKRVRTEIAKNEAEVAEAGENEAADALAQLAEGVEFTRREVEPQPQPYDLGYRKGTYVGSWGEVHLYACKALRDYDTKRVKSGLMLMQNFADENRRYQESQSYFGSLDVARAAAKVMAKTGGFPSRWQMSDTNELKKLAEQHA